MPTSRLRLPLLVALCVIAAFGLASCKRGVEDEGAFPRSQTVYVGGFQWGQPTTFNPLASSPNWPANPGLSQNLLYEPLLVFNTLTGKMQPLLAETFEVTNEAIHVVLHAAARFNDGTPVTAEDVKYSFDLGQDHPALRVATIWPFLKEIRIGAAVRRGDAGAKPDGDVAARTISFMLNQQRRNPLLVLDALQQEYVLPRHVIEPLLKGVGGNMNELMKLDFADDPIGSGPYRLHSFSNEKVVTERRDDYWGNSVFFEGKKAAPKYVIHPVYKSNDHFSVALQQGRLDASSTFIPRIWLKKRKGVRAWYPKAPFFPAGAMPVLWVNHKKRHLANVHLRRAMAFAINYKDIRELAVSGYSEPMRPGLILPFGFEGKYYSEADAKKFGATLYSPERARAELEAAGYQGKWDDDGKLIETLGPDGKRMPTITVKSPTGWTDWESAVRIAVRSMRAVGIDVREGFVDASLWYTATYLGDFDLLMYTPSSAPTPSKPWSRFDFVLNTKDFAPLGEKMYKNMGRFNDPEAPNYVPRFDELLDLIPTLSDSEKLVEAYRELNALFMKEQPVLPLVYRPDQFYEFSTRVWTGFASSDDPFLPPQIPSSRLGTRALWSLELTATDG